MPTRTPPSDSGARVVHTCGFDSIPSDIGAWFTQQRQSSGSVNLACDRVSMSCPRTRGGASGGTIASMLNLMEEVAADPSLGSPARRPLRARAG